MKMTSSRWIWTGIVAMILWVGAFAYLPVSPTVIAVLFLVAVGFLVFCLIRSFIAAGRARQAWVDAQPEPPCGNKNKHYADGWGCISCRIEQHFAAEEKRKAKEVQALAKAIVTELKKESA